MKLNTPVVSVAERRAAQGIFDSFDYGYKYVTLREMPELKDFAAEWFHSKWSAPKEAYLECMDAYLNCETEYGWYLCLDGDKIVGVLELLKMIFMTEKT